MVKVQNSEDASNSNTFSKMEGMILEKIMTMANQQTPLISEEKLRQSIAAEASKSSEFESALDKLVRDGFISRIGIDEFQITSSGIEEHSRRLNEGTLL
ncbi:MAG TPA: hypothetical protein VFT71_05975 [Candidatus Nitrosocosmicus sp.]|nr:hypothetical protein [Candidatus Nitrosocosmicus sp.]